MSVSVENTSSLGRKVTVVVPKTQLQEKLVSKYNRAKKTVSIKGFRKGKVPISEIKKQYGKQLHQEVVSELVESSLQKALLDNKLNPVDRPAVEQLIDEDGNDLEYTVSFEIFPEIKEVKYKKLKITKKNLVITEASIDKTLNKLLEQFAEHKSVDRAAAATDRVTIDFTSTVDGKDYDGGKAENIAIDIGAGQFVKGFEDHLTGATVGAELEFTVTFPDDWQLKTVAGKPVTFKAKVKKVEEKILATADAELAKKIGITDGDVTKIRPKLKENMQHHVERESSGQLRDEIFKQLLAANPIELPQSLIAREVQSLHDDLHQRIGGKPETECNHDGLEDQAKNRAGLSLLLKQLLEQEKIKLNGAKVQQKMAEFTKVYGNNNPEHLLTEVQNLVLIDQAAELIELEAEIVETTADFEN